MDFSPHSCLIGLTLYTALALWGFFYTRARFFLYSAPLLGVIFSLWGIFFEPDGLPVGLRSSFFFVLVLSLLLFLQTMIKSRRTLDFSTQTKLFWTYAISIWAYFSDAVPVFIILWILSYLPYFMRHDQADRTVKTNPVFIIHQIFASLLLMIGASLLYSDKGSSFNFSSLSYEIFHGTQTKIAVCCLLLASFIRQGVFPFHLWVKEATLYRPFPVNLSFYLTNFGFFLFYKMVIPLINFEIAEVFPYITSYVIFSSFYFMNLAFMQKQIRMVLMYIMLSHFSLLFAGLEINSLLARTGVFFQFLSIGIVFTGLFSLVYLIEIYVGELQNKVFYSLHDKNKRLSTLFLIFSLGAVALPFSMNFVGEDMIFHAVVEYFPWLGGGMILIQALNGVNIYRVYLHVFGGRNERTMGSQIILTDHQQLGLLFIFLLLFGLGVYPHALVGHIMHFVN